MPADYSFGEYIYTLSLVVKKVFPPASVFQEWAERPLFSLPLALLFRPAERPNGSSPLTTACAARLAGTNQKGRLVYTRRQGVSLSIEFRQKSVLFSPAEIS